MAIWGGDGSSKEQTKYADTWEDFKTIFKDGNYSYIGFPEYDQEGNFIPISKRVIDLRKAGWITETIEAGIGGNSLKVVYGNNWTILGPSIRNCFFLSFGYNTRCTAYMYDLTIKNAYVFAFDNNSAALLATYRHSPKYFYRLKISGTFDGSGGNAIFAYGNSYNTNTDVLTLYQCSLNLKIHGRFYFRSGKDCYIFLENCLANINSTEYGGHFGDSVLIYGTFRFSKITGRLYISTWPYSSDIYEIVRPQYSEAYNVIDMEVIKSSSISGELKCGITTTGGSGSTLASFIVNKTKIENNGFEFYSIDSQRIIGATQDQITNKDFLESVYFLVGDEPDDI